LNAVADEPRDAGMPPVIMLGPHNQTVTLNADVTLTCLVAGDPTPSVRWQFNGRPMTSLIQENARYENSDPETLRITGQTNTNVTTLIYEILQLELFDCFRLHQIRKHVM
jgi:Immunoglobulin domain